MGLVVRICCYNIYTVTVIVTVTVTVTVTVREQNFTATECVAQPVCNSL